MRFTLITIVLGLLLVSCDGDSGMMEKTNHFEQGPLLDNLGNNLIVKRYQALKESTADLDLSVSEFTAEPTIEHLEGLRSELYKARLAWQSCLPFQFGPAELSGLSAQLNIYPVDANQIERNITEGGYDLNTLANADARGFPSLGYLLYSNDISDQELINTFDESRVQYLKTVSQQIASTSEIVYNAWSAEGGNYIATFTSDDAFGVNVGSSVAQLINAMNITFERQIRDGKVGIPAGMRSNGTPIVENVEAYYAGYSIALLSESIDRLEELYTGADGVGLDDYLKELGGQTTDNEDINERIMGQFATIKTSIAQLTDPLPQQIQSNVDAVNKVFADMQELVLLFKTDMASTLGVVITYQDNDGD
ncbi:MAG: imelysin family protein [Cyclobacteriaceae bacterium]